MGRGQRKEERRVGIRCRSLEPTNMCAVSSINAELFNNRKKVVMLPSCLWCLDSYREQIKSAERVL